MNLFNGRDLSGFYTWLVDSGYWDSRRVFTVTNGMLRVSGDGLGYLATREDYTNYQLTLEYRWGNVNTKWGDRVGRARDSGVFLHATGPDGNSHDGNGAFMAAIECNLFEGATGDFLLIRGDDVNKHLIAPRITGSVSETRDADGWPWWNAHGVFMTIETWGRLNWKDKDPDWKDETGYRGRRDVERPPGEWNRLEITCREGEIEVVLNDTLINHATDVYPGTGRILIQCEGSEIFFRRVELVSFDQVVQ